MHALIEAYSFIRDLLKDEANKLAGWAASEMPDDTNKLWTQIVQRDQPYTAEGKLPSFH